MKILAIAQVEDDKNVLKQIKKQTVQPDEIFIYVDPAPKIGINTRRRRIVENHSELMFKVKESKPTLVWQLEGDGELTENALETLIADYKKLKAKDFGYISGIELGRHGIQAIGAWHFNEDKTIFKSLDYRAKGIQEVDATGFYCLLAPAKVWLKGITYWDWQMWGPDVNWSLSLKEQGYKIYCDMDVKLGHITERGIIHPDNIATENVTFTLINDQWTYKTSWTSQPK